MFTNCNDLEDKYMKCLLDGELIDWSSSPFFYAPEKKFWDCFSKELKLSINLEASYKSECDLYWISKEKANKFDVQ